MCTKCIGYLAPLAFRIGNLSKRRIGKDLQVRIWNSVCWNTDILELELEKYVVVF